MAQLAKTAYPLTPIDFANPDYRKGWEAHDAELATLSARAEALKEGEVVGGLLRFPRGDGYALYLVTKDKPLTLQHVPYGDAWAIDAATIRGLRLADVHRMLKAERMLRTMFGGPEC